MAETDDRPAWVPAGAHWVNGLWYFANTRCIDPSLTREMPGADHQARLLAATDATIAKTRVGLPVGHYRHGGLIYGPNGKIALDLPGGYGDDGSHLPGWAERRATRIAAIQEARKAELEAIAALDEATEARHVAAARAFQSYNVLGE